MKKSRIYSVALKEWLFELFLYISNKYLMHNVLYLFKFTEQVIEKMEKILDAKLKERNKENSEKKKIGVKHKGVFLHTYFW